MLMGDQVEPRRVFIEAERQGRQVPRRVPRCLSSRPEPSGRGRIEPRELEQEMRSSFLDYAMSVIVGARAARRARRPEAGPPPRPLRMWDAGYRPGRPYVKCANGRRRGDGQLPPARRRGDLRHARPAWRSRSRCATRSSTARATSARSTTTRRPRCGTPRRGSRARDRDAAGDRRRHGRLRAELRRVEARAARAAVPVPEPARQRLLRHRRRDGDEHPAAQPRRGRSTRSSR